MSKYLIRGKFTAHGIKGLLKEGGTARRSMGEIMFKGLGGTLDKMYFTLNADEVLLLVDIPDNLALASVSMHIDASGMAEATIIPLHTPEDIDTASHIAVNYRAPGI